MGIEFSEIEYRPHGMTQAGKLKHRGSQDTEARGIADHNSDDEYEDIPID